MMLVYLAVGLTLAYASFEDLRKQMVHDKVFLAGFTAALVFGFFSGGLGHAGSMVVQGLLAAAVGFLIKIVGRFGGADIWAIALASAAFPDTLLFSVLAGLLVPMVVWVRLYLILRWNSKGGPAIPGILIGYFILLSYLGI